MAGKNKDQNENVNENENANAEQVAADIHNMKAPGDAGDEGLSTMAKVGIGLAATAGVAGAGYCAFQYGKKVGAAEAEQAKLEQLEG